MTERDILTHYVQYPYKSLNCVKKTQIIRQISTNCAIKTGQDEKNENILKIFEKCVDKLHLSIYNKHINKKDIYIDNKSNEREVRTT